jgi:hypothetical protein
MGDFKLSRRIAIVAYIVGDTVSFGICWVCFVVNRGEISPFESSLVGYTSEGDSV